MFQPSTLPKFAPIFMSNLCSMCGVILWNWSVADLYFWFWYEFVLAGLTTCALLVVWCLTNPKASPHSLGVTLYLFLFPFLLMLFYATAFAAGAYRGEWKTWDHFPAFLEAKKTEMIATFLSFAYFFGSTIAKRNYGIDDNGYVGMQFSCRMIVVLGLYLVLLLHGLLSGGHLSPISPAYLKGMGITLITLKIATEAFLFYRILKKDVFGQFIGRL
jgi:hypothetical protein